MHQPPTNRSFYLSLAASTLRFAIIVALVIGGIVVIDQAFSTSSTGDGGGGDGGGATVPLTGGTIGGTGTDTTGPTGETADGMRPEPSPTVVGVRIAVFNGAGVSGLAGDTQARLEELGYIATQDPADAPTPYPVTTIYYNAPKDRVEADYLAEGFFKKLDGVEVVRLEPDTADIDPSTQVAIFLGNDYATLKAS
ncbi:MAG TPA: LytR C-terminal domain-containing protein [Actinomycetota bacterium]|nr:LytR C-terminal domain-containing protein [Actinomycetota bacterium]